MGDWHAVVPLRELSCPGARAFEVGAGDWPLSGFVVRCDAGVYAYRNRCPHAGHALNWLPDRFFSGDGRRLLCASHGAMFEPHTGLCVEAPCPGQRLPALPVQLGDDGWVRVDVSRWT